MGGKRGTPEERFWRYVNKDGPNGCWLWTAAIGSHGYGMFCETGSKADVAHRISWRLLKSPIPTGMFIDHRVCRNKQCVNPEHLVVCTASENILQPDGVAGMKKAKTHCVRGHSLLSDNVRITRQGRRACRACQAIHHARRYKVDGVTYYRPLVEFS